MLILITGGSASGKSEYAEQIIVSGAERPRVYIATMRPYGKEGLARIARHRAMRADKGFQTVECFHNLANVQIPKRADVLLECMSNLAANEMFEDEGAGAQTFSSIMEGISVLAASTARFVIVSNEIFSDGVPYDEATVRYVQTLGRINSAIAQRAQAVTEVVCGIPVFHKGEGVYN